MKTVVKWDYIFAAELVRMILKEALDNGDEVYWERPQKLLQILKYLNERARIQLNESKVFFENITVSTSGLN